MTHSRRGLEALPLWKLEIAMEQARRRFAIAEERLRKVEKEIAVLREIIETRREKETP